ncbi:MAG TPA: LCP family protein [Candidatus Nanopelagicales bacterium]|jgi:LCP family protein required for cell wall assembly
MSGAGRALRVTASVAAVVVLLVSSFGWWATNHYIGQIQHVDVFSGIAAKDVPTVDPRAGDSLNILLVGSDSRAGLTRQQTEILHLGQAQYGLNTDTMMIIHIGKDTSHITVVGMPRDSLVTIPDCVDVSTGKIDPAHQDRINAAFGEGGGTCMVKTVEKATNIHIDHYVEVSFTAFLGMVNAVGGVPVCLSAPLKDDPRYTSLNLPAGRSVLTGTMALNFVRSRHVDDDFGRIRRQQQFISSMLHKALGLGVLLNPLKLNDFISAALTNTKVDSGLDRDTILSLAGRLQGINLDKIEFPKIPIASADYTIPGTSRSGYVTWDPVGSHKLFDEIRADLPITAEAAGKVTLPTIPASSITVQVLNGTSTKGLGKTASAALGHLGFNIAGPAQSAKRTVSKTVIRYDSVYSSSILTLAAALPFATLQPVTGLGSTMQVIVGPGYVAPTKPPVVPVTQNAIQANVAANVICPA